MKNSIKKAVAIASVLFVACEIAPANDYNVFNEAAYASSSSEYKLSELELWEGDRIFLELLNTQEEFFSLKLEYEGDKLVNYSKLPN